MDKKSANSAVFSSMLDDTRMRCRFSNPASRIASLSKFMSLRIVGNKRAKFRLTYDPRLIQSFRRFLLFARDTIRFRRPMDPNIHWSAMFGHVSTFIVNGGQYDKIIWTENFNEGMADVLSIIKTPHAVDLETIPRFNESDEHGPKRAHTVEDYFGDLPMHLVYEIFKLDLEAFKYDFKDLSNKMPIGEIDLDEVHKKLGD